MGKVWEKFVVGETTPHAMAFGVAFGTFVALLPTFGFSALITLGIIPWLKNINRPATLMALAFWNPLVQIPIYALSLELGSVLYSGAPIVLYQLDLLNQLHTYTLRFLLGHLFITVLFTVLAYFVVFTAFRYLKRKPHVELWVAQ